MADRHAVRTPTPWTWQPGERENGAQITGAFLRGPDGKPAFTIDVGDSLGFSDADAAFVVCAVNEHTALYDALRKLTNEATAFLSVAQSDHTNRQVFELRIAEAKDVLAKAVPEAVTHG